jgi:Ca2+-binding RTX toxin-like protein
MSDSFNNTNPLAELLRDNIVNGFSGIQSGASTVVAFNPAAPLPTLAAGYGEVLLQTVPTAAITLPANYHVLFDSVAAAATVIGGGDTLQAVDANSGGLTFQYFAGGGVVYTANNPVGSVAATGDSIFVDGGGPAYVAAGEGNDTVVVDQGANFVAVGGGANQVFLSGGSNLVATEGDDQIVIGTDATAAAGSATISLSGNSTVFGGASPLLLLGGAGVSQLIPQTDSLTSAATNTGAVTVFGGAGGGSYFGGTNGGNIMVAGTGATTLVGGGAKDLLFAFGASNDVLQATGADNFLVGSAATGNNQYFAGDGNSQIYGGAGQDVFIAGKGNDILVAGTGADQFDFTAGSAGGVDTIFNFKVGSDMVNLFQYDTDNATAAANALQQAAAHVQGGSTFVTLGDNTTIFFVGVTNLAANSIVG